MVSVALYSRCDLPDSPDSKGHDWRAINALLKRGDSSVASSQPDLLAGIEDVPIKSKSTA
jgi:hypothetical protein